MKYKKHPLRLFLFASLLLCLLTGLTGVARSPEKVDAAPQMQGSSNIVISQVYGGGGNSGATFTHDFIELFNRGTTTVDLAGWSVQYASAGSTTWTEQTNLSGSIAPGRYYLIQETAGSGGTTALPAPDATGTISMAAGAGKIALVNSTTALSGSGCPFAGNVIDFIGYGSGTNCFEGTAAPAPSATVADLRNDNGCIDTDNNNADFATGAPNPRNSASPAFSCTRVTDVTSSTANGTYSSTSVPNIIDITVTFSNAVSVDTTAGTPTLLLETGSTDRSAAYDAANSSSNTLAFTYTIMTGDSSSDLDYVSTNSLVLNGAIITDAVGAVDLTLPSPGSPGSLAANKDIVIDAGLDPSILSFTRQSPSSATTNADTLTFRATFSEAVTGVDSSDFVVTGTTGTATVTPVSTSVYDVTISGGDLPDLNGTVGLNLAASPPQNITDLALNPLPPGEPPVDETYSVDNSVGSATGIVISEFRTAGNDEFIEIYNPTNNWVDISGWKINGSNSSGTEQTRATIPAGTILRSYQYYLVAARSSFTISSGTITSNLTYGTGISDDGGIALFNASNQIVDEVGMDVGSAYQEGTVLTPLTDANRSYERLNGDPDGSCTDTNNNRADFDDVSPSPHNWSTIRSCNGTAGPTLIATTTLITADSPDPSVINGNVSVSVRVTGTSLSPNGTKVYITGANTNCSITLNTSGTGSCNVKFTTTGTKTITATFIGDNTHSSSSDTESHTVSTATGLRTATPSRIPTLPPPPPLVAINEFVPRPGHDWNYDGEVNVRDEYIEIINHGTINVNLAGYSLDDEVNIGSAPYRLPSVTIRPGERIVFYGSETGLLLSDGGDGVRLLKPNGQLADAYNYTVARYSDQSYCRLPDNGGLDDWNQNCYPTPGLQNSLGGGVVSSPNGVNQQLLCPIADTLPEDFVIAECSPYGTNIWRREFWDAEGWYNEKIIPGIQSRWDVFAD